MGPPPGPEFERSLHYRREAAVALLRCVNRTRGSAGVFREGEKRLREGESCVISAILARACR